MIEDLEPSFGAFIFPLLLLQMRRREREFDMEQRKKRQLQLANRQAVVRENTDEFSWAQENESSRLGAEAFVARGADGSDSYAPPEWETDETLEAYIVGDGM